MSVTNNDGRGKMALAVGAFALLAACKGEVKVKTPPPPPPPAPAPPPPPPAPEPVEQITVSERIQFETDSAVLKPESKTVLGEVVRVLRDNPQITLVEIGGHTDSTGDSGENLLLSQERAEAVRAFLISQGIEGDRLRARGYGDRVPVASNSDSSGRLQNRRVEFRIVEQGQ